MTRSTLHLPISLCLFLVTLPPVARAQIVINEVQASNQETILDDEGDSSDWVELYNAGTEPVDLAGYAISDDASELRRWTFPSIVIDPGEYRVVWCSGKNRTNPVEEAIAAPESEALFMPTLVSLEDEWRYIFGGPEDPGPPEDWFAPEFDDADWLSGTPIFGFGEDIVQTEIPEDTGAAFFRREFQLDDISSLSNLILQARYDDGMVIYLNGTRILNVNYIGEEDPTFASRARSGLESRETKRFNLTEHLDLLRDGSNMLGIALINLRPTSSDFVLGAELGRMPAILHTNFELDSAGETVFISDLEDQIIDIIAFPEQAQDRSFGRWEDVTGSFSYMLFPTPGAENDSFVSSQLIPNEILFTPESGKYARAQTVELGANIPFDGFSIHYTLDGNLPLSGSSEYSTPLLLNRDSVVRAAGFLGNQRVTKTISRSYYGWTGSARTLSLPVMSISMRPNDFSTVHNNSSARGITSEREGYVEYFDADGVPQFGVGMGLRLHGGAGRGGDFSIKKAYKMYFRGVYGAKKLQYPMIPDTEVEVFDKFVLRSNFNDAFRGSGSASLIRDQVIRDLHQDMGNIISHGSWHNLLVNMRYRGVYNIVERMDKVFFASYFPDIGEDWDVIKTGNNVLDGDAREWTFMRSFFSRSDFSDPAIYAEAWDWIDVENFTEYMILNIWAQNHDWPHNNWYAARPRREDGRWIFLSWDAEFGIGLIPGGYSSDTFAHVFSRTDATFSVILAGLLESTEYQSYFLEALDELLAGPLSSENVTAHINRIAAIIQPDMPEETAVVGRNINSWLNNVQGMRIFALNRGNVIRNFVYNSNRFSFPRVISTSPRVLTMEQSEEIVISGIRLTENTGVLFGDIPAIDVRYESQRRILATVPFDLALEGRPSITVHDPDAGSSTSENILSIRFVYPSSTTLQPAVGAGGETITIFGEDFTEGVRVEFGSAPSPSVVRFQDSREVLQVIVPPGEGDVEIRVINTRPGDLPATKTLSFTYDNTLTPRFLRGDSDGNGSLNLSDAINTLRYLTAGGVALCEKAMDADDSGNINITDAIYSLNYLFLGTSPPPPAPFPDCGRDAANDALGCEQPPSCLAVR